MSKIFLPVLAKIDFKNLSIKNVEYLCPEEYIDYWQSVIQDNPRRYKPKNKEGFLCAHWLYFIVLKDGKCNIVSGLLVEAWLYKLTMESIIPSINSFRPKLTDKACTCIAEYIKMNIKK